MKYVEWERCASGKIFDYYVGNDGSVFRRAKGNGSEQSVAVFLIRGHATVKLNGRERKVKNLVARHHMRGYRYGSYVECIDGDPLNCSVENLRIYTKSEHGKRTGHLSSSTPISVDGIAYRSIREAAKELYVSYQTLLDYMGGSVKNSILAGKDVRLIK